MFSTKTRRLKTKKLRRIWLVYLCIGVVVAVCYTNQMFPPGSETIAQNSDAQASTTTAPEDSKDNEAREALKAGDDFVDLSEYAQALKQYQSAELLARKTGDWLVQATALSQMGRLHSYLGDNDLAQKQLTEAIDLFHRHENNRSQIATNAYGEALTNLAEVSYAKGDFLRASQQLDSALDVFQKDQKGEARVHLLKGNLAGSIGDTNKAQAEITRALKLAREINDERSEGLALSAMGLWYSENEDHRHAIEMDDRAREIFRTIRDSRSEGIALNAMGQAYEELGEYMSALSKYETALALFEKIRAPDGALGALYGIASTQFLSRKFDDALASYQRCLQLSRTVGNRRFEAYALKGIADIYGAQRRREPAVAQFRKLISFFKSIGDLRGQAMALNSSGDFFLQLGENQKALDVFDQAFSFSEKIGDRGMLMETLYNLARANEALGLHEVALSLISKSFTLIEEIRANVTSPDFRASYFAAVRKHYDLYIEILMQLDKSQPGQGFAAKAFLVTEQGRARLLLDLLSESRANLNAGAAKELVDKERELRGLLRAQADYQLRLDLSGKNSTERTEVAEKLTDLRSEYQVVQAQLKEQNPRLFSFEQFAAVDLARIQKELRGSDTMLLEYALGDEHSYLWAVTSESSYTFELPPRKVIEDAARELYELITARAGQDNDHQSGVPRADDLFLDKARNLSRMVLGPVAEHIGSQRLIVATEGALQYIPFEALPMPIGQSNSLLVETNEVVVLPSASTLIALRGERNHKDSPGKVVAIIADPVFSASDDRVKGAQVPATAQAAVYQNPDQATPQPLDNLRLARLTHASEEADAISDVAPWGTTLVAKGFEANRETAMSSDVRRAQIIHFATHGYLNDKHPELSAIVLTTTDRNGVTQDGLMPLPDIYSLDLSADLVVLSACQTALGKELKGEGLIGLSHSFMSAGARSVVASLWKVDDRATAFLMAEFYKGMLQNGMTPAAALRSAKLKMMHDQQWSKPYYWAGFVLQGEYTNHITVDRHAWLRPALALLFVLIFVPTTLLAWQKRKRRIPPTHST